MGQHTPNLKEEGCRWSICGLSGEDERRHQSEERDVRLTFEPPSREPEMSMPQRNTVPAQTLRIRSTQSLQQAGSSRRLLKKSFSRSKRPVIGPPTDFRRGTDLSLTEPMPARQKVFRPLELSIYIESKERLSPLPDFLSDAWEELLSKPPTALLRRETVDNSRLRNQIPGKPLSVYSQFNPRREIMSEPFIQNSVQAHRESLPESQATSPGENLDDYRTTQEASIAASAWSEPQDGGAQNSEAWRSSHPSGVSRSHSGSQSISSRSVASKREKIDDAINELNMIVEQKRVRATAGDASATPYSPNHVPAIAANMKLQVRTETLADIGSAFSTSIAKPFSAQNVVAPQQLSMRPYLDESTNSSASTLRQPLAQNVSGASRKDRLTNWLRRHSRSTSTDYMASSEGPTALKSMDDSAMILSCQSADSVSTTSTVASASTAAPCTPQSTSAGSISYTTPSTTIVNSSLPTTPLDDGPSSRSSRGIQRKLPGQGLSIDTTLSNGLASKNKLTAHNASVASVSSRPADVTPTRISLAC